MAALLGIDIEGAERAITASAGEGPAANETCEIANDNAPGQVVISGHRARVERAVEASKREGAKMAKLLPVSAPFHSSLMAPAAEAMRSALAQAALKAPVVPLIANVTARDTTNPDEIRRLLVEQVTGRVRWTESVSFMAERGVDLFVEVGTGRVLAGLMKRIAREARLVSVGDPADIDAFLKL